MQKTWKNNSTVCGSVKPRPFPQVPCAVLHGVGGSNSIWRPTVVRTGSNANGQLSNRIAQACPLPAPRKALKGACFNEGELIVKNKDIPAFPQLDVVSCERDGHGDLIDPFTSSQGGMTLRDYMAASAMQGILAGLFSDKYTTVAFEAVVKDSYTFADAMLAARGGE